MPVLAGVSGGADKLKFLDGASLSGSISRDVRVHFAAASSESYENVDSVSIVLDGKGPLTHLERGTVYT